jgi:probable F420-dependent oxidoreductase
LSIEPPTPHRPFRFGVLAKSVRSGRQWRELARRVEGAGYSTLLVPDHIRPQLAPFPALVAAAAATATLRVGTLVLNVDMRHPVLLAREAATVDLLTDGRLELGLGAGWMRRDYDESGIRWERGRVRAARFAESVQIVRGLLDGEGPVAVGGQWHPKAQLDPMAGGQARVPVLIGAGGPRLLETAAAHADIVSISRNMRAGPAWADGVKDSLAPATEQKVRRLREVAGDRYPSLEINILVTMCVIGSGAQAAVEKFATGYGLSAAEVVDTPQHLVGGDVADVVEQARLRRERFGISYLVVAEEMADDFRPVVAELAGR